MSQPAGPQRYNTGGRGGEEGGGDQELKSFGKMHDVKGRKCYVGSVQKPQMKAVITKKVAA